MKVVVCFEGRIRPDSTGFYLLYAFKALGHEVFHVLPEDIFKVKPGDADLFVKCDDGIYSKWNADLKPSHYYCIDSHIETGFRRKIIDDGNFDTVSVAHSQGLEVDWGRNDVYWLPVGCDPVIHHVGAREKVYDGCFIGNFHNNLAGPRVEALDAFFKACAPGPIFFGNRIFQEVTEKYAQSKLVFNRSINGDANMRVFETLCSGSCLVTDRVPDLERLGLVDGLHYAGYSSLDELTAVTKRLLANESEREAIAHAGRIAASVHTYAERMKVLLEKLNLNTKEKEHVNA